ncbi:MAG: cupredoxin domain-containing protein [Candidatus Aminicenantaceae bacterium]|jgi:plastocyanin
MKSRETIAVILVLLATVGTIVGIFGIEKCRRSKLYTLELLARSPKNGNWYPRQIHLTIGKEVRILVRNVETVSHGFALPAFNVGVDEIKAGEVAVVQFTPDKRGTFPFMCTVWCSDEHLEMNGEVIVE